MLSLLKATLPAVRHASKPACQELRSQTWRIRLNEGTSSSTCSNSILLHSINGNMLLRCYSHSETSSSTVTATSPGPKKYNLRPISKDDVEYTFARSGGAGGQNVNKVNTKVDMRFDLDKADWVPEEVKDAIRRLEKNRFTKEGTLFLTSTRHRTQSQNLDDCLAKLQAMLDAGVEAVTPKEVDPSVVKRVQANIKAGNERRLDGKKKDAKKKAERRRRDFD